MLPGLLTPELISEANRVQAEANETFGEDTAAMRMILGLAISTLAEAGGVAATVTYLGRCASLLRRIDDETPPEPTPPPSS